MSSPNVTAGTVLAPLDAESLQALGALSPVNNGKRKIFKFHLVISLSTETIPESLTSASSVSFILEIPEVMISKETYMFLGCSESLATTLWDRWVGISPKDREPEGPIAFISLVTTIVALLEDHENRWSAHEDWHSFITSLGFATEMADAICSPEHDFIRLTESANFW